MNGREQDQGEKFNFRVESRLHTLSPVMTSENSTTQDPIRHGREQGDMYSG